MILSDVDFSMYSSELHEQDGLFYSKIKRSISYPGTGNEICSQLEDNSFWFQHRNNCICQSVKKYCPGNIFFDIGGGNGFVARGLEDAHITTVLVEPGIQGCLNAQKRGLKNIICSTLEEAHFKQDALPAVGLFDVIEHIQDDINFLQSIYHSLQKDGFIFITVPAFQQLWSDEDIEAGHYRRYTITGLTGKLKAIGFEIAYSTYLFSILPIPIYLFRSIPAKPGLKKKSTNPDIDKHKGDHNKRKGVLGALLNKAWKWEIKRIKQGKAIPFGSTCFIIARKKKQLTQ